MGGCLCVDVGECVPGVCPRARACVGVGVAVGVRVRARVWV
jgi:hypothetical protein